MGPYYYMGSPTILTRWVAIVGPEAISISVARCLPLMVAWCWPSRSMHGSMHASIYPSLYPPLLFSIRCILTSVWYLISVSYYLKGTSLKQKG